MLSSETTWGSNWEIRRLYDDCWPYFIRNDQSLHSLRKWCWQILVSEPILLWLSFPPKRYKWREGWCFIGFYNSNELYDSQESLIMLRTQKNLLECNTQVDWNEKSTSYFETYSLPWLFHWHLIHWIRRDFHRSSSNASIFIAVY